VGAIEGEGEGGADELEGRGGACIRKEGREEKSLEEGGRREVSNEWISGVMMSRGRKA
jgi:hypothetical protein